MIDDKTRLIRVTVQAAELFDMIMTKSSLNKEETEEVIMRLDGISQDLWKLYHHKAQEEIREKQSQENFDENFNKYFPEPLISESKNLDEYYKKLDYRKNIYNVLKATVKAKKGKQ